MTKQTMARTLCPGDLCVIAYNNYLYPVIYKGEGRSIQFYMLHNVEYLKKALLEGIRPYLSYVNRNGNNIIAKISEDELPEHMKHDYEDLFYLLKENGYI